MSSASIVLGGNTYSYDFTTAVTQAIGGAVGYKEIKSSPVVCGMVAGDADQDEDIGANDFTVWSQNIGLNPVYMPYDIDMDTDIGANDFTVWSRNIGLNNTGNIPAKSYQLPVLYRSQVPK
jgi:hypothetical protein